MIDRICASFDGILEIRVADGAEFNPGDMMEVISYGQTLPEFDDVRIFGSPAGSFECVCGPNALELMYASEPATLMLLAGGFALLSKRRRKS